MDQVKVAGVQDWPVPCNVTEVKSFLGFINFSHIAKPLSELTKANVKWSWESHGPEQSTFNKLKHLITSTPILVLLDQSRQFHLETDASAYATGAVLSQLCDDEKWRPVGLSLKTSQMLNTTMPTMIRNCFLSYGDWKNGTTFWKELSTILRFSMTLLKNIIKSYDVSWKSFVATTSI